VTVPHDSLLRAIAAHGHWRFLQGLMEGFAAGALLVLALRSTL